MEREAVAPEGCPVDCGCDDRDWFVPLIMAVFAHVAVGYSYADLEHHLSRRPRINTGRVAFEMLVIMGNYVAAMYNGHLAFERLVCRQIKLWYCYRSCIIYHGGGDGRARVFLYCTRPVRCIGSPNERRRRRLEVKSYVYTEHQAILYFRYTASSSLSHRMAHIELQHRFYIYRYTYMSELGLTSYYPEKPSVNAPADLLRHRQKCSQLFH